MTCSLTDKERELLDALARHGSLSKAAEVLGISFNAARQRLYRVRLRYMYARDFIKMYEDYMFKLPRKYLGER